MEALGIYARRKKASVVLLKDFPAKFYGKKPKGAAHSAWEILEHMRIALRDLASAGQIPGMVKASW